MASATLMKRLIRERPHLREPLQWYRRVSAIWDEAEPDDLRPVLVPADDRPLRLARGLPLLDPPRFAEADLAGTARTWTGLLRVMATRNRGLAQAGVALSAAFGSGEACARTLAQILGRRIDPPLPEGVPADFVGYVLRLALRPSLVALLPPLHEVFSERAWNRATCPLCGFPPGLAEEMDRDRRLYCSFCPADWVYTPRGCALCGHTAEQHLACSIEDVEPGYHVAICTRCTGYLKTVHRHEVGREIDPPLEDLLTVPLDHVAQQEGYRPSAAFIQPAAPA